MFAVDLTLFSQLTTSNWVKKSSAETLNGTVKQITLSKQILLSIDFVISSDLLGHAPLNKRLQNVEQEMLQIPNNYCVVYLITYLIFNPALLCKVAFHTEAFVELSFNSFQVQFIVHGTVEINDIGNLNFKCYLFHAPVNLLNSYVQRNNQDN